ncbi:MAG: hypothetical protein OXH31_00820 [Gammaproteobacteria bacterium]|nr:hypothetical protein [Gammaproteobacteria bacterium]
MTKDNMLGVSKRRLVIAGTFATGIAIGILAVIAIQSRNPQNLPSLQEIGQEEIRRTYPKSENRLTSLSPVGVGQFEEIFKHQSLAEQHVALNVSLFGATEQELKDWWIQSANIERTSHREIAQQIILRNLTAINPKQAVRYLDEVSLLQTDALSRTIFSEWAVLNLDEAIEAAAKLVGGRRSVALDAILETRDDLSEEKRRSLAEQLERAETYDKLASEVKALQSIENPRESWRILLNDNVDDSLQIGTLAIIAETWQKQIGFEVLLRIYRSGIDGYWLKSQLLESIVQVDPALALDYVQGLTEENEQSFLSDIIVREWAQIDALTALAAVSTFEPSSLIAGLEEEIARVWARTQPYELIASIELISEESRVSPLELAFSYIAREDPLGAIDMLNSVENSVGNTTTIISRIVNQWAMRQSEAAADWVLNNFDREDPQLRTLLEGVLPSLTRKDPIKAFELALEQPVPNQRSGLESLVIRQLTRNGDIETAMSLLPRVRETSQVYAYGDIASAMVNEGQTFEALELGSDLEPQQQRSYYQLVMQIWARTDPADLYESLDDLPSSTAKSLAAAQLIWQNQFDPIFTDDQLEQARSLLNSDDEARVERFEN